MKLVILCALFAPIIYLAFRQKKWYLYLLFAFIGVLPEQFSVRLHESLPLLTANRVLILILMGFWLYKKWKTKRFQCPKSLLLFLIVNVIISLINLRYGRDDINRIFLLIFERGLLVVMSMDMIDDREEFLRCIDFIIMGCAALAVIGIVQTVFDYDISTVLHLTKTFSSIQLSKRMGLVRAFGTYNAISYGCYCAFMSLLIVYRLYSTKSLWHGAAFALNFVALICTFTRSAWLCLAAIAFVALLLLRLKLIRKLLPSVGMILALLVVLCCFQPKLYKAFVNTGKSSINTVLQVLPEDWFSKRPSADATEGSASTGDTSETEPTKPEENEKPGFRLDEDFGSNANDPAYSRNAQWTAIEYMTQEGQLLFGYGYNALIRGKIHFFFDRWAAKWQPTTFLDVGLVALLTESGLIGALAHMTLLGYMLAVAVRRKKKLGSLDFYELTIYAIPLYLLLNILAAFMQATLIWLFIGLFYAYKRLDDRGLLAQNR